MVVNVDKWLNSADKMMNFATEIMQKSFPQCKWKNGKGSVHTEDNQNEVNA